MIAALIAALAAAQTPPAVEREANRRAIEPVLRQMIGEAHAIYAGRDYRGYRYVVVTRARASDEGGVCARDEVTIRLADADAPASFREVETEHQFHVLKTGDEAPRWDVTGEALERVCADPDEAGFDWIAAESAEDAKAAVLGLIDVRRALAEPASPLIRPHCSGARCFDRTGIVLYPFSMSAYRPSGPSRCGGGRRYRCQSFIILDHGHCAVWHLEMETEWDAPYRVRSADFLPRGPIPHCDDSGG